MGLENVFPDFAALRAQNFAGVSCPKPAIMIAITPRTGSTHLCRAMRQAGHSVEPGEIFNARGNEIFPLGPVGMECARRHVTSFAGYFASFARDPDPAFIFKTGWHDAAPLASAIPRLFPSLRVIYLERKNIAAQAVSQFRAEISGTWHLQPGEQAPPFDPARAFDLAHICAIVRHIEAEKQAWESWFSRHGITPLRLEYRDIETSINAVLRRIGTEMGLPLHTNLPQNAGMKKLADDISADWTERVQKHLYNMS